MQARMIDDPGIRCRELRRGEYKSKEYHIFRKIKYILATYNCRCGVTPHKNTYVDSSNFTTTLLNERGHFGISLCVHCVCVHIAH